MDSYRPSRAFVVAFGIALLGSLLLLADLLSSFADPNAAFAERLENDVMRLRDTSGGTLLLVAALCSVCAGQTLRHDLSSSEPLLGVDLISALSAVVASGLVASSGLLLASPVSRSLGDVTSDPGIEVVAAAGVRRARGRAAARYASGSTQGSRSKKTAIFSARPSSWHRSVAAKAGAGEILIPEPLRHLLTGKSYVYAERGETMLKGFEDAVRLYEVRWRE
jgi:hypothetical protein